MIVPPKYLPEPHNNNYFPRQISSLQNGHHSTLETLKGWPFQLNEGTNDYSLFFGLLDKNGNYLLVDGIVDIRIVNKKDEVVYMATRNFSKDDFVNCTNQIAGEQFLINVRIPTTDIEEEKCSSGKVFLTVYNENAYAFDESELRSSILFASEQY